MNHASLRQMLRAMEQLPDHQPVKLALSELRDLEREHLDTLRAVDTQMCRLAAYKGAHGRVANRIQHAEGCASARGQRCSCDRDELRALLADPPLPAPIDPAQAVLPLSPLTAGATLSTTTSPQE